MNIQCVDDAVFLSYIAKYITKPEPNGILAEVLVEIARVHFRLRMTRTAQRRHPRKTRMRFSGLQRLPPCRNCWPRKTRNFFT